MQSDHYTTRRLFASKLIVNKAAVNWSVRAAQRETRVFNIYRGRRGKRAPRCGTGRCGRIMKAEGGKRTRSSPATDNVTILSSTEDDDYRHKEICGRYIPCSRQPVTRQTTPNSRLSSLPLLSPLSECSDDGSSRLLLLAHRRWIPAVNSKLDYTIDNSATRTGYEVTRPRTHRKSNVLTSVFEIFRRTSLLRDRSFRASFSETYSERDVNFSWVVSHVIREKFQQLSAQF